MNTLRTELTKHSNFLAKVRHTKEEKIMQHQNVGYSRNTGGQAANKRYKRTAEELEQDIAKVDELVASGKYNQIEALNVVGLQSSVYHYKKRLQKQPFAKSVKPRKSQHYVSKKNELLQRIEASKQQKTPAKTKANENDFDSLKKELDVLKAKYDKLSSYLFENVVMK